MKLLPWMFAALLAIAVVGLWTERGNSQARYTTTGFNPLAPASAATNSPPRDHPAQLPASDSVEALTEEVRGLRADLKSLLAQEREPVGENEVASELRRLISTLEKAALHSENSDRISLDSVGTEVNDPAILNFHERANAAYEETKRSYLLRSQQEVLSDLGVPDSISRTQAGSVTWGYNSKDPTGNARYIGISFIDGLVSEISASR